MINKAYVDYLISFLLKFGNVINEVTVSLSWTSLLLGYQNYQFGLAHLACIFHPYITAHVIDDSNKGITRPENGPLYPQYTRFNDQWAGVVVKVLNAVRPRQEIWRLLENLQSKQ